MGDRKRVNVEGDRLSSLADDLIHKILSFVSIKCAVETSVLSPRWRFIWTSMPYLSFSSNDFRTLPKFSNFVKHVFSSRNNQIEVFSVDLTFRGKVSQAFVKRILDYAFSHNVQQLNFTCLHDKNIELPLSLFSSRSLKHLSLTGYSSYHCIMTPPTWELPALATLNLRCVTLRDNGASLFSHSANLKNLTLKNCRMMGLDGDYDDPLQLSTDLLYLEKVNICIHCLSEDKAATHKIVCLLQQLHTVKFLTLNLELVKVWVLDLYVYHDPLTKIFNTNEGNNVIAKTLKIGIWVLLTSSVELISHQPSPFTNLKSLKIYPVYDTQSKVTMSNDVKNYLLDNSPDVILTMVSHEEIRAVMDVTSARNLMRELQVLLDDLWKENGETNTAHMKQVKAPMEIRMSTVHGQEEVENYRAQRDTKSKHCFHERMTHIESYWEDLNEPFEKGYKNTRRMISMLRSIEGLLQKVPRSLEAKLQARFSVLRAEAETIMENMMDRIKIQCDKRPSRSNVYFDPMSQLPS
ncbi:putative leucine-rich repeat domain superfamily, F-box-like domain superfamily [Helianthus annuus]|nr:putative leucine-rich repeat domain superfamily, F-box-like domain superfamily [Helianthus annuus]